ncbi:MAG TPA: ABATE domain-containing protein [Gaiellaceae bacterium]|nr:ABATE domain-containing protein [Gaiellaceae bacterium]
MVSTDHDPRYQRVADGLVLPATLAGDPALDFCNTRAGWNEDDPREYLTSYHHVAVWTREAGLVDAATAARLRRQAKREPADASRALSRALRLRDALYAACTDAADAEACDAVAAEARRATAAAVLVRGSGWSVRESAGLDLPTLELARAAGALLTSPEVDTVGRCPGHHCGWLFLDPRGRRRWCTMAVCGNRAKARRHALRTRV